MIRIVPWMLLVACAHIGCWAQDVARVETIDIARAHQLAMANAPNIALSQLMAAEAAQQVAQARAGYLPTLTAYGTIARAASDNTRLAAGALNNPSVYDRNAAGVVATQLITDFGRTTGAIDAALEHAQAEDRRSRAAIDDILLAVDLAYYRTLQSQARQEVVRKTVENRRLLVDRLAGMVANQLKSALDLSYARVSLGEGEMLAAQVGNELKTDRIQFATLLGLDAPHDFTLVDAPPPPTATLDADALIAQALQNNPAIQRLRFEIAAARRSADAEQALDYPSISAIGAAGLLGYRDSRLQNSYAAGALNLSIPLYAGGAISARQDVAGLRARMAELTLRSASEELAKDIRIAVNNLIYTESRQTMAAALLAQASQAFDLAESRFGLGLSSLIELNQAELNKLDAAMTASVVKQDLFIQRAILDHRVGTTAAPSASIRTGATP